MNFYVLSLISVADCTIFTGIESVIYVALIKRCENVQLSALINVTIVFRSFPTRLLFIRDLWRHRDYYVYCQWVFFPFDMISYNITL